MLKNQTITIVNSNKKWTSIRYVNSTAKGRVNTTKLKELFAENKLDITNPTKLTGERYKNHIPSY